MSQEEDLSENNIPKLAISEPGNDEQLLHAEQPSAALNPPQPPEPLQEPELDRLPLEISDKQEEVQNSPAAEPSSKTSNDKVAARVTTRKTSSHAQEKLDMLSISNKESSILTQCNASEITINISPANKTNNIIDDPTSPLLKPKNLIPLKMARDLGGSSLELLEARVLVIECALDHAGEAAAHYLLDYPHFKDFERRVLDLEIYQEEISLETFSRQKIGTGEKVAVLIKATRATSFLDSLISRETKVDYYRPRLTNANTVVIIQTRSALLKSLIDLESNLYFPKLSVPALGPFLYNFFGSNEETARLEIQITQQRALGLWQGTDDDEAFLNELRPILSSDGLKGIEHEIAKRNALTNDSPHKDNNTKDISILSLFEQSSDLQKTILLVAALFQNLRPEDFETVLLILLEDRCASVTITKQIVTGKGKIKQVEAIEERPLRQVWTQDPDGHLQCCQLQVMILDNQHSIIDFRRLHFRSELLSYIKQRSPLLLRQTFERLRESGLMFDPSFSRQIADNMVRLTVENIISDPSGLRPDWLVGIASHFRQLLSLRLSPETTSDQFFHIVEEKAEVFAFRRIVLQRLADLIREMLEHEKLHPLVNDSFDYLLRTRHHDEALILILEVTKRLRFIPNFDALFWMKRLIDESPVAISMTAMAALEFQVHQDSLRAIELLEQIATWLPHKERPLDQLSPSNRYSLCILLRKSQNTIFSIDPQGSPLWPSRYPLFQAASADPKTLMLRLELMCRWLFHPAMISVISEGEEDPHTLLWQLRADFLELWFFVLQGAKPDLVSTEALSVVQELLKNIILLTDSRQQALLLNAWRARRQSYISELQKLNRQQVKEKELLLARRLHSCHLEQQLKSLRLNRTLAPQ